ncbi:ABC transporter substrate-binding protein OS=Streptomyces alboniger OX=132473 GN=CP975_23130 PE=4 SV=1 [Streptomyces alboniger]
MTCPSTRRTSATARWTSPDSAVQTIAPAFYTKQWKGIDPKVLQGLSMAIDRNTITKTVLQGTREPATGWVAKGVLGYQPSLGTDIFNYDPAKAKQLIKEGGGVPGNKISIQFNGWTADLTRSGWRRSATPSPRRVGVACTGRLQGRFRGRPSGAG